jgi:hypothetical protein
MPAMKSASRNTDKSCPVHLRNRWLAVTPTNKSNRIKQHRTNAVKRKPETGLRGSPKQRNTVLSVYLS